MNDEKLAQAKQLKTWRPHGSVCKCEDCTARLAGAAALEALAAPAPDDAELSAWEASADYLIEKFPSSSSPHVHSLRIRALIAALRAARTAAAEAVKQSDDVVGLLRRLLYTTGQQEVMDVYKEAHTVFAALDAKGGA